MIVIKVIVVEKVFKNLFSKFNSKTIMIFDDIQDNLHFKDLMEHLNEDYYNRI